MENDIYFLMQDNFPRWDDQVIQRISVQCELIFTHVPY